MSDRRNPWIGSKTLGGLLVPVLAGVWACGGPDAGSADAPPSRGAAVGTAQVATAPWPSDQCGWIPVAAVESIMGPLAGPPRPHKDDLSLLSIEGGCLYPLPEDTSPEAIQRRKAARELREAADEMARRMGESLDPIWDKPAPEPAVILQVEVGAEQGERGIQAAEKVLAGWAGGPLGSEGGKGADWDYAKSPVTIGLPGFLGRVGQLSVTVISQGIDVPAPKVAALAASVRDRIPDRPFQDPEGEQRVDWSRTLSRASQSVPDPCGLLTRSEAEKVLGPLTVAPYRIRGVYPDPHGISCAYRTAGHRVLALTPQWTYGRAALEATRDLGGVMSQVLPGDTSETADTLDGPWDEAVSDWATGDLTFVTGDRALEVSYGTSSTDAAGAVQLARIAVDRLGNSKTRE